MVINYRSLLNFDQLVHFEKIVEKCIYNNLINIVVDCIAVERRNIAPSKFDGANCV